MGLDKLVPQISVHYRRSRHFKDTSLFVNNNARDKVNEGIPENTSIFLSEILLSIFEDHNIDVSLYVSPPDSARFCKRSLDVSVDTAHSTAG